MKAFRTILLILALLVLVIAAAAGAGLYYVYRHPHTIKPLAEELLSGALQGEVTIEALAFGVSPIRVTARGVRLGSASSTEGAAGLFINRARFQPLVTGSDKSGQERFASIAGYLFPVYRKIDFFFTIDGTDTQILGKTIHVLPRFNAYN